ncbi:MAG: hypothetical protein SGARI_003882 [Bacillariaceae sp.]
MKGGGERLIDSSRKTAVVRTTFVSGDCISPQLVNKVSSKACEFYMTYRGEFGNVNYYGQGGFIRGAKIDTKARSSGDREASPKRARVAFEEDLNYEATPVTAKHNLRNDDSEKYSRTVATAFDAVEEDVLFSADGGCKMTKTIEIRAATDTKKAIEWSEDAISFGDVIADPSSLLTKDSRLFEVVPDTFSLRVGHRIGLLVYRTFDITHKDAKASLNTNLMQVYGEKYQVCIYTGRVTEVSANGRTFCHDINAFKGCSGAIVFLLDLNQSEDVPEDFHGRAVGINVGGMDTESNLGFLIN